ncbi:hypothetical protein BV921_12750 [Pectobacterium odoriferum]|nr:hypothetical protein BV925_13135 [Pectobacterium odoriferum]POD99742.1 hypothetical protein BVY05_15070 [Pectobacterium odoriferum]POE09397.1 hypothetical protein BV921_12750 [Pectobacterium odoriferum]POE17256.1 hypothetical protein BV918_13885 [Pectobacterium odoriferum]POE21317.1 hypothetical protein BV923_15490 [Pectobacterium odoriferum]
MGTDVAVYGRNPHLLYSSYFKLHVRWLHSVTRITYLSKLIGTPSLAAFLQLELFRVKISVESISIRKAAVRRE